MITQNVRPREPEPPCGVNMAPEVKYRFRVEPPGFYKEVLSQRIVARDEIKHELEELVPKSVEYHILEARQKAVKVITNAS